MAGSAARSRMQTRLSIAPGTCPGLAVATQTSAMFWRSIFAFGAAHLPAWARARRKQMEQVAERLALPADDDTAGSA